MLPIFRHFLPRVFNQNLLHCTTSMTHGKNFCDPPWLFLPLGLQRSTARAAAEVHELRIDSCRSLCVFHSCPVAAHYLCIQHCFLPAQRKHETRTKIFPNNNVSGADTHCGLTEKVDAICGDGSHAFPEESIVSPLKAARSGWVDFPAAFH